MSRSPEEAQRLYEQVKEARERVAASPAAKLQSELAAVARMYRLFLRNEEELRRHFDQFAGIGALLELWDQSHPDRFESFLDETDRLLHNYLAAASSLADHTMRLWKSYPPDADPLTTEYQRRVKETFIDAPVANFVRELRNLTTHRQLPVIQGTLQFTGPAHPQGQSISTVTGLNKEALLASGDWNQAAKAYLGQTGDTVDIKGVVADYTASVQAFNDWFGKTWVEAHLNAFDELRTLVAEHDGLLNEAGVSPPSTGAA